MAEAKTKATDSSVADFLSKIADDERRADAEAICALMEKASREKPKMWGSSIIGFGSYHYKYASGHEGDTCKIGFSPRKANFALYLNLDLEEQADLLRKLGKHKTGKACLYINSLADVDQSALKELIKQALKATAR